jgi:hypothetical protein
VSREPRGTRRAVFGFLWLALFSILYTAGERLGVWPPPPSGAFQDWDLAIGALGAAALAVALAAGRP